MGSRTGRGSGLGAALIVAAVLAFLISVAISITSRDTAYVWHDNMISDLGDSVCGVRAGRMICSPNAALFNAGLVVSGLCLIAAALCLPRRWGPRLASSVAVMGVGLIGTGIFPAGTHPGPHLIAVVLALVVPSLRFLLSAIRPPTPWLCRYRLPRAALATAALGFAAESRLPGSVVPRGAGELAIVGALLVLLSMEAARLLAAAYASRRAGVSRSRDETVATGSPSQ